MEYISHNLEETKEIAHKIANKIKSLEDGLQGKATVIGLSGELGSGKTTFMKYFAKEFGVEEEVQSPTFVIMRIFELPSLYSGEGRDEVRGEVFKKLIHIDAYRLEKSEELLNLGWEELLKHPGNLICIEWPEKVANIMPPSNMLHFSHGEGLTEGQEKRIIKTEIGIT